MEKIYSFVPKKTLLLISVLTVAIIILAVILLAIKPTQENFSPLPVITQPPSKLSLLQKTVIGQTTTGQAAESFPNKIEKELRNGNISYSLPSSLDARPNEVIFKNNIATFERVIIDDTLVKVSDLITRFGQAEKVSKGSEFYGPHTETYIYAKKGLAFIGNPNTDEVYELQVFAPISLEEYLSKYGEDIKEYGEIRE